MNCFDKDYLGNRYEVQSEAGGSVFSGGNFGEYDQSRPATSDESVGS